MTKIHKPGSESQWNKATCLKCPATAFIRVPVDEEKTVYMCPECSLIEKVREDLAN